MATVPAHRVRARRRRRRDHRAAGLAAFAYAAFAAAALLLVLTSVDDVRSLAGRSGDEGVTTAPGPEQLALTSIGSRAQRSTLGVGRETGFVAWEQGGLALVLTSRPASGWRTGTGRSVPVSFDGVRYPGVLARTDPVTGLGLVRVRETGFARSLWDTTGSARVRRGDFVVIVDRRSAHTAEVGRVGRNRIELGGAALGRRVGSPVLGQSGRLVGVLDANGSAVPIARACGVIRRC